MLKFVKKIPIWLVLLILVIPTFWSLIRPGFFPMQDDLQAFRFYEMDQCIKDWQIPCRWVPDMGYQYGYPQFNYYPPSVYYLGEIFHLIGFQFIDVVKIMFALGFLLSALTMYFFLKEYLGEIPALVGGLLYSLAPYKAVEVYVRGDMSEFWSFVFFPLIFWFSLKLIKKGGLKNGAFLALSIGGLMVTHLLISMIFLPLVGVWIIYWLIVEKKLVKLPKLAGFFIWGFLLSSFFVLPILFEKQFAHTETLLGGYFGWQQHFVPLKLLFFSNRWGYGSSNLGQTSDLSLSVGIIQWVVGLLAVMLYIFSWKKNRKLVGVTILLGVMELVVVFMIHVRSSFIWNALPFMAYLQFPWRFLSDSTFLLPILGALFVYQLKDARVRWGLCLAILIALLVLYGSFFRPRDWYNITDADKFSGQSWEKELTISIFDYLPIYAKLPPIQKAPDKPEVLDGKAVVSEYKKGSDYQMGEVQVASSGATLRLPLFDFPGMKVWVDGKEVDHWNNDCRGEQFCLGLITFRVPQGQHSIKAQLTNTPVRTAGNGLTVVSLLGIGFLLWKDKRSA